MEPQAPPPNEPANTDTSAPVVTSSMGAPSARKRWLLIAAVVLIALLLIGGAVALFAHSKSSNASIDNEEHKYEAIVTIDSKGFMPGTLTVKPDTEVFFENHSQNSEGETGPAVQVVQSKAAAKQTADFNSDQIPATSGYGYTFRKAGTYQFYNAANVKQTVTVIVK